MLVIDVHTHCTPRAADDPFDLAYLLKGKAVGRTMVAAYRGLLAVAYPEMHDLFLQQQVYARAGIPGLGT